MKYLICLLAIVLTPQSVLAAPAVVEFYTSQSCSSCPSADKVLEQMASSPNIISFGCHVAYWNHLNWKDSLSLATCDERQRQFGQVLNGGNNYTPQAIINGHEQVNGSRADLIRSAIRQVKRDEQPLVISFAKNGSELSAKLPELPAGQRVPHRLTLVVYGKPQTVAIPSGENSGKKIMYAKPVILMQNLPDWQGSADTRIVDLSALPTNAAGVVMLGQRVDGHPIEAAGEYKF